MAFPESLRIRNERADWETSITVDAMFVGKFCKGLNSAFAIVSRTTPLVSTTRSLAQSRPELRQAPAGGTFYERFGCKAPTEPPDETCTKTNRNEYCGEIDKIPKCRMTALGRSAAIPQFINAKTAASHRRRARGNGKGRVRDFGLQRVRSNPCAKPQQITGPYGHGQHEDYRSKGETGKQGPFGHWLTGSKVEGVDRRKSCSDRGGTN